MWTYGVFVLPYLMQSPMINPLKIDLGGVKYILCTGIYSWVFERFLNPGVLQVGV